MSCADRSTPGPKIAGVLKRRAFPDTSVLLGGLIELGPAVRPAQDVMATVAEGRLKRPLTAWHSCLEFYAVATRLPEEFRLAPADALRLLEAEILGRFEVAHLSRDRRLGLLRDAVEDRGGRGTDLRCPHRRGRP